MSITRPHNRRLLFASLFQIVLVLTLAASVFTAESQAGGSDKYPKCFIGTYLIEEGSGTTSLWSLGARGVITITSSVQQALDFSSAQGAWIRTGKLRAATTSLDFSFDSNGDLLNIAKINADLQFRDKSCTEIEGEFTVYFYEPGVDPLDPGSVPENVITDTFTGRRVTVEE